MTNSKYPRLRFVCFLPLVAVAALGIWLARNRTIVETRQTALAAIQHDGCEVMTAEEAFFASHITRSNIPSMRDKPSVPAIRGWLGDQPIGFIQLLCQHTKEDQARLQVLFPEAVIRNAIY